MIKQLKDIWTYNLDFIVPGLFLLIILTLPVLFIIGGVALGQILIRDPKRKIPTGKNIISPANGKIVEIINIDKKSNIKKRAAVRYDMSEKESKKDKKESKYEEQGNEENGDEDSKYEKIKKGILGKIHILTEDISPECYIICIMMNLYDVHVQKSPIRGTVKSVKYTKGKFLNAVIRAGKLEWIENEKNEIIIEGEKDIYGLNFRVKVIQIAGLLARRIDCFVKEGEKIDKGQNIGLIKLGSQVTMIIPKNGVNLKVKKHQKVIDGETIIAEI